MLFIGHMINPMLVFHASIAATKIGDLHTRHVKRLASTLRWLMDQVALLQFNFPTDLSSSKFGLDLLSDTAAEFIGETNDRSGSVIFKRYENAVHSFQWTPCQLHRAARSSATAENLAAAETLSNGLYIRSILNEVNHDSSTGVTADSKSRQTHGTRIKEPGERYNRLVLAAI